MHKLAYLNLYCRFLHNSYVVRDFMHTFFQNTSSRVHTLSSRMGSLDVDDDGLGRQQDVEHSAGSDEDVSE